MKIDIITLFPGMFDGPFKESIVKRAQDTDMVSIALHNLRDWSTDSYRSVDDRPFGGGAGMVMRVDIIDKAVTDLKAKSHKKDSKVLLLDTKGTLYNQGKALEYSTLDHIILIAGHYEGIDHRVHDYIADEVVSIGPYVLTGGEIPAMVLVDSIVRLLPGVVNPASLLEESYNLPAETACTDELTTEYPQYTRPAEYKGWKVPEVLLSGNHKEIEKWRKGK